MAGRDSIKLFIYLFCKQNGTQETEGIIIQIRENSLLVFVPKFGIEGKLRYHMKRSKSLLLKD